MKKEYLTQILGIMKVVLIIILGIYILLSPTSIYWQKNIRIIFALIIIAYGIFRSVNLFHKYKNKEDYQ